MIHRGQVTKCRNSWPNASCQKKEGGNILVISERNEEEYKPNAKFSSETYMAFYQDLEKLNLTQVISYLKQGVNPFLTNDRDPFKILDDSSQKYPIYNYNDLLLIKQVLIEKWIINNFNQCFKYEIESEVIVKDQELQQHRNRSLIKTFMIKTTNQPAKDRDSGKYLRIYLHNPYLLKIFDYSGQAEYFLYDEELQKCQLIHKYTVNLEKKTLNKQRLGAGEYNLVTRRRNFNSNLASRNVLSTFNISELIRKGRIYPFPLRVKMLDDLKLLVIDRQIANHFNVPLLLTPDKGIVEFIDGVNLCEYFLQKDRYTINEAEFNSLFDALMHAYQQVSTKYSIGSDLALYNIMLRKDKINSKYSELVIIDFDEIKWANHKSRRNDFIILEKTRSTFLEWLEKLNNGYKFEATQQGTMKIEYDDKKATNANSG